MISKEIIHCHNNFRHIQLDCTILNSIHPIFAMTLKLQIKLITLKTLQKILSFSSGANNSKAQEKSSIVVNDKSISKGLEYHYSKKHKHTKISYLKII